MQQISLKRVPGATLPAVLTSDQSGVGNRARVYHVGKRCLDLSVSMMALFALFPVILVIALLIKLDSPGPVLFTQLRVGSRRRIHGRHEAWEVRHFRFFKFRSMVDNADQSLHQAHIKAFVRGNLAESDNDKARYKLDHDPRITRVGRILRNTSLDELPQIFNVLKGEMSLVGPRPVPIYEVDEYESWHYGRLCALPGITGRWQVEGRGQVSFDEMLQMDLDYVRHQSLWLDFKIMVMTIPAVFQRHGAA